MSTTDIHCERCNKYIYTNYHLQGSFSFGPHRPWICSECMTDTEKEINDLEIDILCKSIDARIAKMQEYVKERRILHDKRVD